MQDCVPELSLRDARSVPEKPQNVVLYVIRTVRGSPGWTTRPSTGEDSPGSCEA